MQALELWQIQKVLTQKDFHRSTSIGALIGQNALTKTISKARGKTTPYGVTTLQARSNNQWRTTCFLSRESQCKQCRDF